MSQFPLINKLQPHSMQVHLPKEIWQLILLQSPTAIIYGPLRRTCHTLNRYLSEVPLEELCEKVVERQGELLPNAIHMGIFSMGYRIYNKLKGTRILHGKYFAVIGHTDPLLAVNLCYYTCGYTDGIEFLTCGRFRDDLYTLVRIAPNSHTFITRLFEPSAGHFCLQWKLGQLRHICSSTGLKCRPTHDIIRGCCWYQINSFDPIITKKVESVRQV